MYERHDVLRELKDELSAILPEDQRNALPEVPKRGDLDLREVLISPYFFA
jgi:DNA-directed RNA polymerase